MLPAEISNKRILISPLNWGMGHVSRCIPIVDFLLKQGNSVIVAGEQSQLEVFRQYFPGAEFLVHNGYPFAFGAQGNFSLDLAKQFKALRNRLREEEREVNTLVDEFAIDLVISDHRYGFRSNKVHSILITHQLNLPVRWYEGWVQRMHHRYLRLFDAIWVPDLEGSELAGQLSANSGQFNVKYIGPVSRFQLYDIPVVKTLEKVIVVSGPTVYGKKFLEEQLSSVNTDERNAVIIAPKEILIELPETSLQIQSSEDWRKCDQLILQAKKIVSRSGYSTLMDLTILKVPFSITPTPGQREQEYLFDLWYKKALRDSAALVQNKEHS